MIFVERIKRAYDRSAQNYDAGSQLQRHLADKLAEAIGTVPAQSVATHRDCPYRILDIGCGTGNFPYRLVGCDISFAMLSRAKAKSSGFYTQADAMRLPFADSLFDLVVSNAAYQWVKDLVSAFKEAKRVLKDAGRFYFTIFNKNTLWQLQGICREIRIASSSFPDRPSVSSALTEAGFDIISIETFRYKKYYKDLWELLFTLKKIGSNSADNNIKNLGWRRVLSHINDLYLEKFGENKGLPATYEAFLIKCRPL